MIGHHTIPSYEINHYWYYDGIRENYKTNALGLVCQCGSIFKWFHFRWNVENSSAGEFRAKSGYFKQIGLLSKICEKSTGGQTHWACIWFFWSFSDEICTKSFVETQWFGWNDFHFKVNSLEISINLEYEKVNNYQFRTWKGH